MCTIVALASKTCCFEVKYSNKKNIIKMSLLKIITSCGRLNHVRFLFMTPKLQLKQIQEAQDGNSLTISATIVPSERVPYLLKHEHSSGCPVCASGLDIKHTDVLILSQFVRLDGCMLPRRITGLCRKQQKRIAILVAMAQKAGLMPNLTPPNSKKDPKKREKWKKFNTYFDETTIKVR